MVTIYVVEYENLKYTGMPSARSRSSLDNHRIIETLYQFSWFELEF